MNHTFETLVEWRCEGECTHFSLP